MYLIDYRLGQHTGLELVRDGFARRPFAPVIMLTGQADYEIDLEATALGVTDYLVKQELDRVGPGALDPLRDQPSEGGPRPVAQRGALRAGRPGRQRRDLGLGPGRRPDVLLAPLARDPRPARAGGVATIPPTGSGSCTPATSLRLESAIEAHLTGRTPHLQSEHRIRHADGTWRWV